MHSLVQPDAWVALKLPNGTLRVLQVAPNTTISLGKYGSFPSNLIIQRPYHLTYELQAKLESENFHRLRIVPALELYADILSSRDASNSPDSPTPGAEGDDDDDDAELPAGAEYTLVDASSGAVVAKSDETAVLNDVASATQTLTMEEIEVLKKDGTGAGQDIIAKLMLSHTAIDQKTEYSLAKYKLLKTKKYIRRFTVLPMDVPLFDHWLLEERDSTKILEMREEMIGLLGCWGNVHWGGESNPAEEEEQKTEETSDKTKEIDNTEGRYLVVDDTGGLLVAAMAERLGILYPAEKKGSLEEYLEANKTHQQRREGQNRTKASKNDDVTEAPKQEEDAEKYPSGPGKRGDDLSVPYARSNTLTLVHANSQPNLSLLKYYDFDITNPSQTLDHPLARNLMALSWLQLLEPTADTTYMAEPPAVSPDELKTWKTNRRANYHRKRRRWARVRHVVDTTRAGSFSGLVVASTMDPISIMKHAVPLLAGGAPIAIYSQTIEPLTKLADCYSIARRGAWISDPPEEVADKTPEELEHWEGTEEFPLNPTLVLGAALQTSRIRKWQVLPGRTHPLMTSRGGAEGYVFTAWRVKPAEGKVEARGKGARNKKRKVGE
ncbi:adenine-N(1)--methyltransferase non-catalytic subunit trm6 [Pestalotiopsis sp. NC0098]|nr:adenine-N(1)--methyltransferase non-catalytic subunit trm6 [Pestalotiopsis sp. NC0098]